MSGVLLVTSLTAQEWVCDRKQSYSHAAGIRAASRMTQREHYKFIAYRCRYCDRWHVGHDRPLEERRQRSLSVTRWQREHAV